MKILDDYHEKNINIDDFKNEKQIVTLGIVGMKYAHPSCRNWKIFIDGTQKFKRSIKLWLVFAKFVAIYPSENTLLSQILFTISTNKFKGSLVKQMMVQAFSIYTERDSTLNSSLKIKLNRSAKNVESSKIKIRQIWDLAIQGSINEMEASIDIAYQSVSKSRSYFNHLLAEYPNNRFVARNYLRFIHEIEGDPDKYAEWSEKVSFLHRGISVNVDKTNLLGLHAYPNLMTIISDQATQQTIAESESFTNESEIFIEDNNHCEMNEQISWIRNHIEEIKIPGTNCIKIWNIILFVILILLPSTIMLVIIPNYLDSLSKSLHYMYHLSYLRSLVVQIPVFESHYLNEQIGFYPPPLMNMKPEAYGYENETNKMLRYILRESSSQIEQINQYRSYKKNNEYIKPVHEITFSGIIPYQYYANQKSNLTIISALQGCVSDMIMSATKFIEVVKDLNCGDSSNENECWELQNTTMFLNPYWNFGMISNRITNSLSYMRLFLSNNQKDVENLSMFICLFVCIVYALIFLGILVYQLQSLENCKKSIYKCLISLPKNVVSSVSESLKSMKKSLINETSKEEEINTDINKQEENILKLFSSSSDASSMKSHDKSVLIACTIFLLACAIVNICMLSFAFPKIAENLNNNAPHLDYILGTSSFGFSAISSLDNLILTTNCHGIAGSFDYDCNDPNNDRTAMNFRGYLVDYTFSMLSTFIKYYHSARFGAEDTNIPSYSLFEDAISNADSTTEGCEDYINSDPLVVPRCFNCYPSDIQINLFKPMFLDMIIPIGEGKIIHFDHLDPKLNQLWNMITMGLYSKILFPMFDNIVPEMENKLNSIISPTQAVVILVIILAFICMLFIVLQIIASENRMRFALSLLIECPPNAVMQTPKIMEVLYGNFSQKTKDFSSHNNKFFDSIVESIPDSVIICNARFVVTSLNKSTERIYGINSNDLIDHNVQDFFMKNNNFSDSTKELFEKTNCNIRVGYKRNEDNKHFLEITMTQISNNYVIVTKDVTQTILYNTLISEERTKSDSLLASILPPNLVKRVQNGEKNISFGVQSASILFLDIVEFTPWCASNTAAMVMSTLNTLFGKFDAHLSMHSTMTKIKCIGDCYMCAGGIFVEINQSALHAKETVEFGLEAISVIEENNKEKDLSLRIRVGVNTGGPIVAGVLGTEKPTFEILGPAINMAQQMEHHGVPMKVHVSRATYELIYGGSFLIKERGQIEIKKGEVLTYLVESKK